MYCPKCNAVLPDPSAFCNKCGAPIGGAAPAARPPVPAGPAGPQEPEEELWKGRFSGMAKAHWWIFWVLELSALLYLWFFLLPAEQRGKPANKWILGAAAAFPLVLICWNILVLKCGVRYRLTNYRLFKETGLLSRDINETELIRVDDVSVHQSLMQRIFNVGTITVIAPSDQTDPSLELVGIKNPIEVKELIRTHVRRRRAGSINLEQL